MEQSNVSGGTGIGRETDGPTGEMLTLRTLGPLGLAGTEGEEVSSILSQPKRFALLIYLAVSRPGAFHRRDTLLALFWPERDEVRARNALSQSLSYLRRNLPGEILVNRSGGGVGIKAGSMVVDVLEFQAAVQEGRWADALDLYRGPFLQGFHVTEAWGFEDWLELERKRLREAAAGAAWSLAEEQVRSGAVVEAERTAQRAMDLVYTDESPVRVFMEALARAGDRVAALNFYDRFTARLREKLDMEPSTQTVEMAEAIKNGEVAPRIDLPGAGGAEEKGDPAMEPPVAETRGGGLPAPEAPKGRFRPLPSLRPLTLLLGSALILAGSFLVHRWLWPGPSEELRPERVAVVPFENRTGDPGFDDLGSRVALNIQGVLGRSGIGEVLSQAVVDLALREAGPEETPDLLLPDRTGAGILVSGDIFLRGDSLLIQAHCLDVSGLEEIYALSPVLGPRGQGPLLAQQVADRVAAALAQHLDSALRMDPHLMPPPMNLEAYQEFRRGYEVYKLGGTHQEALDHFQRAWELDPSYLAAPLRVMALASTRFQFRQQYDSILSFLESSRRRMTRYQRHYYDGIRLSAEGQQELAYREFLAMAEISPLHAASGLTEMALMTNHIETAIQAAGWLEKGNGEFYESFVDFWPGYWSMYSHALHHGGRYEKQLETSLEWRERFPASAYPPVQWEAYAKVGLGRLEDLDAIVADWRSARPPRLQAIWDLADELQVHGHGTKARAILEDEVRRFQTDSAYLGRFNNQAMVLHRLGRDEEAHRLWEAGTNLDRPDPWPWGVARIGFSAALTGDTAQAREMERLLMSLPEPQDPYTPFLQAKIAAALGEKDRAVRILTEWARRGTVLFWLNNLHRDFTFQSLLGDYPPFHGLMRPKE